MLATAEFGSVSLAAKFIKSDGECIGIGCHECLGHSNSICSRSMKSNDHNILRLKLAQQYLSDYPEESFEVML